MKRYLIPAAIILSALIGGCAVVKSLSDKVDLNSVQDSLSTTTTTTIPGASTPVSSTPAPDATEASMGFTHPATIDCTLTTTSLSASLWKYTQTGCTWRHDDECGGEAHMFMRQPDGTWYGGKYDWFRYGASGVRTLENIEGGYGNFASKKPVYGQAVAFVLVEYGGRRRSNASFTTWQGGK